MHKIVGVVGMCGAGKSRVTDFFKELNWNYVYFGGVTMDELKKYNLPANEKNEREARERLRKEYGPAAYAILLKDKIAEYLQEGNTVLDGLYSWQEFVYLKKIFGDDLIVLAVVTNRNVRYQRLGDRVVRPLDSESACLRDFAEIENMDKGGPIAIADYYIMNNGSEKELFSQLENFLNSME